MYRQIIQQIEEGILRGTLKSGQKLPTIRSLAVELRINPNTIARAYNELEIRGIVTTQVGSGTYISGKKPELHSSGERTEKLRACAERFLREAQETGASRKEALEFLIRMMGGGEVKA